MKTEVDHHISLPPIGAARKQNSHKAYGFSNLLLIIGRSVLKFFH